MLKKCCSEMQISVDSRKKKLAVVHIIIGKVELNKIESRRFRTLQSRALSIPVGAAAHNVECENNFVRNCKMKCLVCLSFDNASSDSKLVIS